jgi:hypothetical protein
MDLGAERSMADSGLLWNALRNEPAGRGACHPGVPVRALDRRQRASLDGTRQDHGRGEGSSGIRFDVLEPPDAAIPG